MAMRRRYWESQQFFQEKDKDYEHRGHNMKGFILTQIQHITKCDYTSIQKIKLTLSFSLCCCRIPSSSFRTQRACDMEREKLVSTSNSRIYLCIDSCACDICLRRTGM